VLEKKRDISILYLCHSVLNARAEHRSVSPASAGAVSSSALFMRERVLETAVTEVSCANHGEEKKSRSW
jgi:hypothetical protein